MSMNPEQLGAVMDFPSSSEEKTEGRKRNESLVDLEQMMAGVFTGKTREDQKRQPLSEEVLSVELVANPSEVENPPEDDDRDIRDKTGPSLRAVRINAGSPTGEKLPVYKVNTGEMIAEEPIIKTEADLASLTSRIDNLQPETEQKEEASTLINEILEPVKEVERVEPEKPTEENPVVVETVKEEPVKEGLIVEGDESSARQAARARLEKIGDLFRIDSQLLAAQIKRDRFEQLENRNAA